MSEDVKPRQWTLRINSNNDGSGYIYSGNDVSYPKDDYLKVIELEPMLQLMKEMGEALKGAQHMFEALQYDVKQERGVGCDDKCSSYGHSTSYFLTNNIHKNKKIYKINKVLEKYRKFLEGVEK